jgi:hypothetical protein
VFDTLRFWDGLEWLLAKTIGLHRQPDTSVRGCGPGPAWLRFWPPGNTVTRQGKLISGK